MTLSMPSCHSSCSEIAGQGPPGLGERTASPQRSAPQRKAVATFIGLPAALMGVTTLIVGPGEAALVPVLALQAAACVWVWSMWHLRRTSESTAFDALESATLGLALDTLSEGIARLEVPEVMVTDGPHGLRKQTQDANRTALNRSVPATCFPTAPALAARV